MKHCWGDHRIQSMCVISRIPSKFQARPMWSKTKLIPTSYNNAEARKVCYLLILQSDSKDHRCSNDVCATSSNLSYPHSMVTAGIFLGPLKNRALPLLYENWKLPPPQISHQNLTGEANKNLSTAVRTLWTKDYYNMCWVKREHQQFIVRSNLQLGVI